MFFLYSITTEAAYGAGPYIDAVKSLMMRAADTFRASFVLVLEDGSRSGAEKYPRGRPCRDKEAAGSSKSWVLSIPPLYVVAVRGPDNWS